MAISRFWVTGEADSFCAGAQAVVEQFSASAGCESAELVRNLDDPDLWAIVSRWVDVGSYRRAFSGTEAKLTLIPLLSKAIDEPSAYAKPDDLGRNRPRGTVG